MSQAIGFPLPKKCLPLVNAGDLSMAKLHLVRAENIAKIKGPNRNKARYF